MGNLDKEVGKTVGGNQWVRVIGTPISVEEMARQDANVSTFNQPVFTTACDNAGIKITKRQASKWNNKKGAAYNFRNKIDMNGFVAPVV